MQFSALGSFPALFDKGKKYNYKSTTTYADAIL